MTRHIHETDTRNLGKVATILNKHDVKIPFACMVELSELIPVQSTRQNKEKEKDL